MLEAARVSENIRFRRESSWRNVAEDIQNIYKRLQKIQRKLDILRADSESSSTNEEEEQEVMEEEESDHNDAIKKGG